MPKGRKTPAYSIKVGDKLMSIASKYASEKTFLNKLESLAKQMKTPSRMMMSSDAQAMRKSLKIKKSK